MITPNNFRFGTVILLDGQLYSVVSFMHVKPGKGGAYVRTKLRRMSDGNIIERTFRSEEKIEDVRLETRQMQYLYRDGDIYYFMDTETFEQIPINAKHLGDNVWFIVEGSTVQMQFFQGEPIGIELPPAVEIEVESAEPGLKGDTATSATKPAKLVTGYVLQVPLFIEPGDKIKVDTRTGEYLERV